MRSLLHITTFVVVMGLILSACTPLVRVGDGIDSPTPQPEPQTTAREAQVQSVQIQVMSTEPPQVNAIVRGNLSESCATLGESKVEYGLNTFRITVYAVSPTDRGCAQAVTPFETTIALDTNRLQPGTYTVIANGVSAVFTLQAGSPPATIEPTAVPTIAPTPVPTSRGCTDSAAFVSDVSIPDNMQVAPGTAFTKTWRLRNTGTCTWNNSYLVSYIVGTTMTQQPGYWIVGPGEWVAPGQSVDISVGMTAPMQNGYYASYWGLTGRNGRLMPIYGGANGNSFYVKIRVNDGSIPPGKVTGASIDIGFEQGSGSPCTPGATYFVHAYITADGPTTAHYSLDSSNGQGSAGYFMQGYDGSLYRTVEGVQEFDASMFPNGGIKTITLPYRFVGPYDNPGNITVSISVDNSHWYSAKLRCE